MPRPAPRTVPVSNPITKLPPPPHARARHGLARTWQSIELFDDLTLSSSGWGGDPENITRARVSKYHVYDFTGLFRRDQNYFDYDLLANPLNPPSSTTAPATKCG